MKPSNFLRYVLLPIAALAAGIRLGVKYAQGRYVSKDRKFIEGEVVNKSGQKR